MIGALRRRLARPSRIPAPARLAIAALAATGALTIWSAPSVPAAPDLSARPALPSAATPTKSPDGPGAGNPTAPMPDSPALQARGFDLYQESCASCHGLMLQGERGVAPSLIGVGAGPVDFYLSTGRMPLSNPKERPLRSTPAFDHRQIDALVAYIHSFGGPAAPTADPARGSLGVGFRVFSLNCAGCHSIVARGGITVDAQVPALQKATAQQVAEAVRMGPYVMPRFSAGQIDQHQLDSLARYVLWTRHPENFGGWGIGNIGPVPEGIVAWFLGLAALVIVARLIGERTA